MDELESPERSPSRRRLMVIAAAGLLLVAVGVVGGRALRDWRRPPAAPAAAAVTPAQPARPPAPAPEVATPPSAPVPAAPKPARSARPRKVEPPPAAGPAAPTAGTLRFEADVEGAAAFIDRVFVGNVPVTVENVAPGPHRINVTATGYDSHSEDVEVTPGPRDVVVRFREVRLNTSVAVVHKHGMGSCSGRLVADVEGLRYETSNQDHAFTVKHADVETLDVNYLEKNLRLKVRGGRTFNFTDKAANADALYVFQRDVQKARDCLAKGDPPARK